MYSSGKKGKKSKGTVISLQSFLSNGDVPGRTTQVAKNIRNVDGEDSDDERNILTVVCQLPTAPRGNRIFDDNSIPQKSPFIAYVTNLPFDVQEKDIYELFNTNNIISVRLPREDGDTGRLRGFGYVEFESRNDLIQSLSIIDPKIKGRRIRIDLSNENEQNSRQRSVKRGYDLSNTNGEGRELSNWRRDNTKKDEYVFGSERNFNEQKYNSEENNSPGSWRKKGQSTSLISSGQLQKENDKEEFRIDKNNTVERPKLMLKPRTLPIPELDVPSNITLESKNYVISSIKSPGISAQKVFGSAKPVDTTARDLEIEKRLADFRRQDNLRQEITKTANDLNKISLTKGEGDKSLNENWRQQNENGEAWKNKNKRGLRTDTRRECDIENRKKYQYKVEGCDDQRIKEGKRKDVIKIKDAQGGKNVRNLNESAVSTNKYSGLDDDSD